MCDGTAVDACRAPRPCERGKPSKGGTANVRTCLPHQEDAAYSRVASALLHSKVQFLEMQVAEKEMDVVGIQEGTSKQMLERQGLKYRMRVSPADQFGCCGVQLWIKIEARFKMVTWQAVSPRLCMQLW